MVKEYADDYWVSPVTENKDSLHLLFVDLSFPFFFFFMGLEQVDKIEDSFDIINSGTKPLAAYLFTNNKKLKQQFVETVSAGGLVINDTAVHVIMLALLKNHTLLRSCICTY